jgi:tetratricopeptide (TPR) repeat protein
MGIKIGFQMKRHIINFIVQACFVLGINHFTLAGVPWYVSYDKALRAQDKQEWQSSIDYLQQALAEKPKPQLKAKTYGLRFVDYLPYFYLGTAYFHLDNKSEALKNFEVEEQYGEIKNAGEEYAKLAQFKAELKGEKPAASVRQKIPAAPKIEKVKTPEPRSDKQPWYTSYEIGMEYIESGDWLRATDYLKRALAVKNTPSQYARTYGMWFIAYFPYYYLGLAYYNQGLWQNAVEYFEKSEKLGELKLMKPEYADLQRLLADSRAKSIGAAQKQPATEDAAAMVNKEILEGIQLFNEAKFPEAEKKFKAVLQLDPYNSLAKSYLNKISAASKQSKAPSTPKNDFIAGLSAFSKGQYDDAIALFSSAKPAYEKDADFHAYLGAAHAQKYLAAGAKDKVAYGSAFAAFARALEIDADYKLDSRVFSKEVIEIFNSVAQGKR